MGATILRGISVDGYLASYDNFCGAGMGRVAAL